MKEDVIMSANHHLIFSRNKSSQTLTITDQNSNLIKIKVLKAMKNMVARKTIPASKKIGELQKEYYTTTIQLPSIFYYVIIKLETCFLM